MLDLALVLSEARRGFVPLWTLKEKNKERKKRNSMKENLNEKRNEEKIRETIRKRNIKKSRQAKSDRGERKEAGKGGNEEDD
jgi:hypothetical protein